MVTQQTACAHHPRLSVRERQPFADQARIREVQSIMTGGRDEAAWFCYKNGPATVDCDLWRTKLVSETTSISSDCRYTLSRSVSHSLAESVPCEFDLRFRSSKCLAVGSPATLEATKPINLAPEDLPRIGRSDSVKFNVGEGISRGAGEQDTEAQVGHWIEAIALWAHCSPGHALSWAARKRSQQRGAHDNEHWPFVKGGTYF